MKNILRIFTIFTFSIFFLNQAQAYVTKTGNVSGEYWHNTDTYYVTGVLTVDAGTTFEIQAGTRVKFGPSASIEVNGTIICNGNSSSNIIFTSMDDNSVGETITGSDGNPNPGDWGRIYVNGFSSADGIGLFNHVVARYGGNSPGNIYFYHAGTASLQNCIIRLSASYGIGDNTSNIDVDNCAISNNSTDGINCYMSSPSIDNCEFSSNGGYAAYIRLAPTLNIFTNNTGSGNTINAFGISGTIDQNYTLAESACGFPFVLLGPVTLNENYTMTIPAGEVIKAAGGGGLIINGTLNAIGTSSQDIVFTSLKDDTYGGDLNGDGATSTPAKGDWSQIMMSGSFAKQGIGNMDYCKVLYAGSSGSGAVNFSQSDEEGYFKNGTIQYSESRGLYAEYVTLEVTNNQFLDNDLYGVYAYADAVLDLSNSTFNNNGNHGINASSSGELQINNCQFNNNGGYAAYLYNIDNLLPFTNNTGSGNTINAFGISGTIDQDYTLSQSISGFPFVIIGDLTIIDNYTLTIPPGEIIKFSGTSVKITCLGTLDAQGTETEKIVFTSLKDDTFGGDLNGDGDATNPAPGDWAGLFMSGSVDTDGKGFFDHCIVRYAGTSSNSYSAVYFSSSDSAFIKNSNVEFSQYEGIEGNHSDVIVENCSINNNGTYGINMAYGMPQINDNQINNNGDYAVYLANIDMENYSGNTGSGNTINAFGINTGTINQDMTLSESITGFPYVLLGSITVNDNVTLTIPPGEIIKATGGNTQFITLGTINALGSETQKIIFTSLQDDTFGGDLNNDGSATNPAPGNWAGLYMSGTYDNDGNGYFDHCIVRYAGTSTNSYSAVTFYGSDSAFIKNSVVEYSQYEGIEASHSNLVVDNCSINNNGTHGIYINNGNPEINNCQFNNNDSYAAYLTGVDIISYTNNTGAGNTINAFGISGNVKQDLTLSQSITGFPFVLVGDVTVYDNCTLTIPPGEIIKLSSLTTGIQSNGTIDAQGTNTQPIIFTSLLDDSYGGDLNGDGDATSPAPGDWEGILLNGSYDNDGNGFFDHCVIRYGGISNNSYSAINFNQSDSAFIKNSIVEYGLYDGLRSYYSSVLIKGNTFQENSRYGVTVLGSPVPNLGQNNLTEAGLNTFVNNDGGGIQLHSSSNSEINAFYNDWGYYTETEIDTHIYDDNENASYGEVHFNPWYDPSNPPFEVNFGADTLYGEAPLAIQFTDSTLFGANYWEWDFENDGMVDSYDQNPSHLYFDGGLYSVKLKSSNGIATDSLTRVDYINITPNQHLRSYALNFDGVDDFVEVPNFTYPNDITVEAWIKPENLDYTQEIVYFTGEHSVQFRMDPFGSILYGIWDNVNWNYVVSDTGHILINQWNHLAVTNSGNHYNLYINGVQRAYSWFDSQPNISSVYFGIRSGSMDRNFSGAIDEVRIWSKELSQFEIRDHMTNYLNGTEDDLMAYYRLNDVAGQKAYDFTTNGFNGIIGSSNTTDDNDPSWVQTNWPYDTYFLADFLTDHIWGSAQLNVQFTDISMNDPEGWQWDFENDGNIDATVQHPEWTYAFPGFYSPKLIVTKGSETDTIIRYINISDPVPVSIAEARLLPLGSIVTIEGIITSGNEYGNLHFIQDETAGAGIYEPSISDLRMGDSALVMGETAEYNGLFELINISYHNVISRKNPMPDPQVVSITELGPEHEAEVVRIDMVDFPYGGNSFEPYIDYEIIDPSGTTHFRMHTNSNLCYQRAPEATVSITGICSHRTDDVGFEFGIYARDYGDLIYTNIQNFENQAVGFTKRYSFVNSISVVDENVVWATAIDGKNQFIVNEFSRSDNGGQTWQSGTLPNHYGLQSGCISAVNENKAWVTSYRYWGENPQGIYHTSDGGATWNHQPTAIFDQSQGGFPNSVYFWDEYSGICMGDPSSGFFEVYTTTDGGNNWVRVPQLNIPDPIADEYGTTNNYTVNGNTIWFPTNKGRIYQSTDQGYSWTVVQTPLNSSCLAEFKNQNDGLLISQNNGELYRTSDGGNTWNQIFYNGNMQSRDLEYVPGTPGTYVATGYPGSDAGANYTIDDGQNWFYFNETHGVHLSNSGWISPTCGFIASNNVDDTEGGMWKYTGEALGLYAVEYTPENPTHGDYVSITVEGVTQGAWLHWGINGWQQPDMAYWPENSELFQGTGPAIQTEMIGPDENHELTIVLGPFNHPSHIVNEVNFVIHFFDETWDNNSGADYHITIVPAPFPTYGIVAYYPFNGNANDESGNDNHGTPNGATLTSDRFGNENSAFNFNGSSDYIVAPADSLPTADRTISFWFYTDDVSNHPVPFAYGGGSCGNTWFQSINQGGAANAYSRESHCEANILSCPYEEAPEGQWYHWVMTNSPDGSKMYINGTLLCGDDNYVTNTVVQNTDLAMGVCVFVNGQAPYTDPNVGYFNGMLDDFIIYDRALDDSEIMHLYTGSLPVDIQLNLKTFLEGPYNGIDMNTDLNDILPLQQSLTVIGYNGDEEVQAIPNEDIVDWIGLELRDATDINSATSGTTIGGGAFFLLRDGTIVGLDGSSLPFFSLPLENELFVAIWHRNHLPVLSKYPLIPNEGIYSYDFTISADQVYENNQSSLEGGAFGMISGDANADGTINGTDGIEEWYPQVGKSGYLQGDVNMDGQVDNSDKNDTWLPNVGKSEQFPIEGFTSCGDNLIDERE
jgi:PKD repeat protein